MQVCSVNSFEGSNYKTNNSNNPVTFGMNSATLTPEASEVVSKSIQKLKAVGGKLNHSIAIAENPNPVAAFNSRLGENNSIITEFGTYNKKGELKIKEILTVDGDQLLIKKSPEDTELKSQLKGKNALNANNTLINRLNLGIFGIFPKM